MSRRDSMLVSIGVPSLNYGRFLATCLESIRTQTHDDIEVLVADAGSSDDSLAIVGRIATADSRIRLVSTSDTGQADAVQRMFEASSGEIFGFLNADDCFLRSDAVALAVETLRANPRAGLVSFGGWYIDEAGARRRPVRHRFHPRQGRERLRYRTAMLQPGTFWRREVQDSFPLKTDLCYVFDNWFFFEAFQAYEWVFRTERTAGYRLHGSNKSAGMRADRVRELADFEAFKFGPGSARERYLRGVAAAVHAADALPAGSGAAKRALYLAVNSLSYATFYRLPGI